MICSQWSLGHRVLFGFRQQEVLGVISTGEGKEAWVYSLGSFPTSSPSPYVTMSRFSYFLLPLASPWLRILRLPFSLALRSCITCYPHLVQFFLNSPQWSSLSVPSIFCWDLGLQLVGNKKPESVRRGFWTDLCYGRLIWKPHRECIERTTQETHNCPV